jgi:hypothetical protein
MEQALINELIRLLCKAGGETFVGNFQKDIDSNGNFSKWSPEEVGEAIHYIKYMNEYFGRDEAVAIITSLIAKYNVDVNDLALRPAQNDTEKIGVGEVQ